MKNKNINKKNIVVTTCILGVILILTFVIKFSVQDTTAATACMGLTPNEVNGVCCPVTYNYTTTTDEGYTLCHNSFFTKEDDKYVCKSVVPDCSDNSVLNGYTCSEVTNDDGTTTSYIMTPIISYCSSLAVSKVTYFTAIFDGNGGTIDGKNSVSKSCTVGTNAKNCSITDLPTPTRDGYVFSGWSLNGADTTGVTDKVTISDDSTTYYATWKKQTWVEATLVADGVTGYPETVGCYSLEDSNCEASVSTPTREGYTFSGWSRYNTSDCPGVKDVIEVRSNVSSEYNTFYACWSQDVTSNFDANGGKFEDDSTSKSTGCTITSPNTSCIVDVSDLIPTKDGYEFTGWGDNCSTDLVTISGNETIKACWTKNVTSTLDANGGTFEDDSTTKKTSCTISSTDTSCEIDVSKFVPERDGYEFSGWGDSCSTNSISISSDTTIKACWTKNVTPVLDANGGKFEDDSTSKTTECTISSSATSCEIDVSDFTPERDGYEFTGWGDDCSKDKITVSGNDKLMACWTKQVTSNFDANGGKFEDNTTNVTIGCTVKDPATTCEIDVSKLLPTREGYGLAGWGDNCSTDLVTISGNETFKACWTRGVESILDANGGKFEDDSTTKKTNCTISSSATTCEIDVSEFIPERDGYEFTGWGDNCSTNKLVISKSGTIKACWTKDVTSTFDANGGTFEGGASTKTAGCIIKSPATSCSIDVSRIVPEREGYKFTGWGDGCSTGTITMSKNETLKACWVKNGSSSTTGDNNNSSNSSSSSNPLVPSVPENIDKNPQTGQIAMFIVWIIGLVTVTYSIWYFMKNRKVN